MGETNRTSSNHLNLWARSSDIRSHKQCDMRTVLSMLWPEPLPTPIWFAIGTALHAAYEHACFNDDCSLEEATTVAIETYEAIVRESAGLIETKNRNADRALHELIEGVALWWEQVHPSSDNRLEIYNEYEWPPLVEVKFAGDGFAGEVDAIFTRKDEGTHALVDWKTGSTAKADEAQLHFYNYGLSQTMEDYNNPQFDAWFHHVVKGRTQHATQYYGDSTVAGWIKWSTSIKKDRTFAAFPGWYCDYCECRSVCPVFNDTDEQVGELIVNALLDEQHPDYGVE